MEQARSWRRIRTGARWSFAALIVYVLAGNALHHWVFRMPAPDPATFPRAGDVFSSTHEGFHQRVLAVRDGWLVTELLIEPGAKGPPLHFHRGFAEEFVVQEGVLHVELADRVVTIGPGESYRVEAGVAHRPFNPGGDRVVVASDAALIPQSFAACLVQLYPVLDESDGAALPMLLQTSVMDPICDTHLAGVPAPMLGAVKLLVAPAARLLGYRNYDVSRALHRGGAQRSDRVGADVTRDLDA